MFKYFDYLQRRQCVLESVYDIIEPEDRVECDIGYDLLEKLIQDLNIENKGYIAIEGSFYTNWEFSNQKVFKTKKALHDYMRDVNGHGFTRDKKEPYHDKWRSVREEYGYIIEKVEIL